MKAEIEVECQDPKTVIKALTPLDKTDKFKIELKSDNRKLEIKVKSDKITGLMAGINSQLRLIRSVIDMEVD